MTLNLYISVLNFNDSSSTIDCVASLLRSLTEAWTIIVIDNGSAEHDLGLLRTGLEEFKNSQIWKSSQIEVVLLTSQINLGYAGGNNLGISYALERDAEAVLILNNDIIVSPGSIDILVQHSRENKIDICGSIQYVDSSFKDVNNLGVGTVRPSGVSRAVTDQSGVRDSNFVIGSVMLVTREVFLTVGLIPDEYFLYYEEADFCFRAIRLGFKIGTCSSSKIVHFQGRTTGHVKDLENKPFWIDLLQFRNRVIFSRRYLPFFASIKGLILAVLKRFSKYLFRRGFYCLILVFWAGFLTNERFRRLNGKR